jgi:phage/plasmid-like protein (TIGR03299 family)
LGQEVPDDASIEEWQKAAYMDWQIERAAISYSHNGLPMLYEDKHVLYRSDNGRALGVVSPRYKIVQPKDVLEFYRDLCDNAGFKLKTAGVLFGGSRFWALADTGSSAEICSTNKSKAGYNPDVIKNMLLLSTACDGSMATTARDTSICVVCNNTLSVAVRGGSSIVKVPHSREWKPHDVKEEMGLITKGWDTFMAGIDKLASTPINPYAARDFLVDMYDPRSPWNGAPLDVADEWRGMDYQERIDSLSMGSSTTMTEVWELFEGAGMGADLVSRAGTWWGMVNAITQYEDHHGGARTVDARMNSAWFGSGDKRKTNAFEHALELVAA